MVTVRSTTPRRRPGAVAAGLVVFAGAMVPAAGVAGAAPTAQPSPGPATLAIAVAPTSGITDGQVVDVTIDGTIAPVTLLQCDAAISDTPDVGEALGLCDNPFTVDRQLRPMTVGYPVVEQMVTSTGKHVTCGDAPADCVVAAAGRYGTNFTSVPVSVVSGPPGPLGVRAWPAVDLEHDYPFDVDVWGGRTAAVSLAQCRAGVDTVAALTSGPCTAALGSVPAGRVPDSTGVWPVSSFVGHDGSSVDCAASPGACVIAAGEPGGTLATHPLTFRNQVVVGMWPWHPLGDGEVMDVLVRGLAPETSYAVVRCVTSSPRDVDDCEDAGAAAPVVSDAAGDARTTVTARSALDLADGRRAYCRDACAVAVVDDGNVIGSNPFGMAVGALAATPDSGLADGQVVELTGTQLSSSYDGPPFWVFPATGGWAVAQCAGGVLDAPPTIMSVFTACAPVAVDATVPLTSLDVDVPVTTSVTPILGGSVDCASAPGACALVLTRVEHDGTVSLHGTRVSFA